MSNEPSQGLHGNNRLIDALEDVTERYRAANPKSHDQWKTAQGVMPGGNTRTVLHYEPFPVTMIKGEGTYLHDMDGNRYTDFLGEYSAGLYGHSNPLIQAALREAIAAGTALGAPNQWEAKLAEILCQRFPSMDMVRFTNSGTEANLMALGAARAFTGRDKIMVFDGGYHGGVLYFGHGGTPMNVPFDVVYAPYNDEKEAVAIIEANRSELAAVIIEPMMGSGGCLPAEKPFLKALRNAASQNDIILIFDEVMTSRSSAGGLQQRLGITPDITTVGKYIGGGSSFGAFGGRHDIMAQFDPTSPLAQLHSGTFNNNVMSMAAGYTGLSQVFTPDVAEDLYSRGETFKARLIGISSARGVAMQLTGCGSLIGLHAMSRPILVPADMDSRSPERLKLIHLEMMLRGFSHAQRGYLTLNLAMTDDDLNGFADAFDEVLGLHVDVLG